MNTTLPSILTLLLIALIPSSRTYSDYLYCPDGSTVTLNGQIDSHATQNVQKGINQSLKVVLLIKTQASRPSISALTRKAESTCNCDCDTIAYQDCSGPGVVLEKMDATVACYIHDHCYSVQSDKKACDKQFRHNVKKLCKRSPRQHLTDWLKLGVQGLTSCKHLNAHRFSTYFSVLKMKQVLQP